MAENQKKIEDQQKKMVSISGSHSGAKMKNLTFLHSMEEKYLFLTICLIACRRKRDLP